MVPKRKAEATPLQVVVQHFPAPDAAQRLVRAFGIIFQAAARANKKAALTASDGGEAGNDAHL
jgi:hypothetical protein